VSCSQCFLNLWIVHSWLPLQFSLDCPFLIAPSVFSGLSILDCPFSFPWIVHSWLPLQFSLDCPFLIVPSVFSGLSILDCPFSFLWIVHSWLPLQFSLTFVYQTEPIRVSSDARECSVHIYCI
jgi:hypothetical protein